MSDHKLLIAVPALDVMPVQTAYSMLTLRRDCPSRFSFIVRASCHDARNMLACEAIESGANRVLWLDSDMVFEPDLLERLSADIDEGWDMVCGIYFKRELPTTPVIYRDVNVPTGTATVFADYPRDCLFPIGGCGFGAVLMTTDLLKRIDSAEGGLFTPLPGLSEDLSFCARVAAIGARMACDSRIKVGHVGQMIYAEPMYQRPGG